MKRFILFLIVSLLFSFGIAFGDTSTFGKEFSVKMLDCSNVIAEGQACYDIDDDILYIGTGLAAAAVGSGTPEGTAILSTGEAGGTKFLREDGDGTCSWQEISASGDIESVGDCTTGACPGDITYTGFIKVIGPITGNSSITLVTAANTVLTAADCRGQRYKNGDNDAAGFELPTGAVGLGCCFFAGTYAQVLTIDVEETADTDVIELNGTALAGGNAIDSGGTAGEMICLEHDGVNWFNTGRVGVWVDGGAD